MITPSNGILVVHQTTNANSLGLLASSSTNESDSLSASLNERVGKNSAKEAEGSFASFLECCTGGDLVCCFDGTQKQHLLGGTADVSASTDANAVASVDENTPADESDGLIDQSDGLIDESLTEQFRRTLDAAPAHVATDAAPPIGHQPSDHIETIDAFPEGLSSSVDAAQAKETRSSSSDFRTSGIPESHNTNSTRSGIDAFGYESLNSDSTNTSPSLPSASDTRTEELPNQQWNPGREPVSRPLDDQQTLPPSKHAANGNDFSEAQFRSVTAAQGSQEGLPATPTDKSEIASASPKTNQNPTVESNAQVPPSSANREFANQDSPGTETQPPQDQQRGTTSDRSIGQANANLIATTVDNQTLPNTDDGGQQLSTAPQEQTISQVVHGLPDPDLDLSRRNQSTDASLQNEIGQRDDRTRFDTETASLRVRDARQQEAPNATPELNGLESNEVSVGELKRGTLPEGNRRPTTDESIPVEETESGKTNPDRLETDDQPSGDSRQEFSNRQHSSKEINAYNVASQRGIGELAVPAIFSDVAQDGLANEALVENGNSSLSGYTADTSSLPPPAHLASDLVGTPSVNTSPVQETLAKSINSLTSSVESATTPSVSQQVSSAIVELAGRSNTDTVQRVAIELEPAELGSLLIQVEQTAESIVTQVIASEFSSKELLHQHRDQLIETLSELGFENASVDISHQQKNDDPNDSRSGKRDANGGNENRNQSTASSAKPKSKHSQSRLDIVA